MIQFQPQSQVLFSSLPFPSQFSLSSAPGEEKRLDPGKKVDSTQIKYSFCTHVPCSIIANKSRGFSPPPSLYFCGWGRGEAKLPLFCRMMNNFLSVYHGQQHYFYSNESVRFPVFNFAACLTNFVASSFH